MVLPNAPEEYLLASSWEVSRRTQPRWAISAPNHVRAKDVLVLSMEQMMWATGVREKGAPGSARGGQASEAAKWSPLQALGASHELDLQREDWLCSAGCLFPLIDVNCKQL